jgi:glucuronoarabinoxylan endo-1,4-beta-xylanase
LYWTIEPSAGVWDWTKDNDQVWLMNEAKKRGVDYFWSATWSMPAWMKDNDSIKHGGHLKLEQYQNYADYLSKYVQEYKKRFDLDIKAVSITNEPALATGYQSCQWDGAQLRNFIKYNMGPTFKRDGVQAKILMPESHVSTNLPLEADSTMNDPIARDYVSILGWHQYNQSFDGKNPFFPPSKPIAAYKPAKTYNKEIWQTEVSFIGGKPDSTINWGLGTSLLIHNAMAEAEVNAWVWWVPLNSWKDNEGLADISGDKYIVTKRLYCFGNWSKFIRPGYFRIGTAYQPAPNIFVSAFKNPGTNDFVVVMTNNNQEEKTVSLSFAGLKASSVTPWVTSSNKNLVAQPVVKGYKNVFSISLEGSSVTTLVGKGK